jgi:CHAT domain-containing protein/Flp pilus assembly protein TadD
MAFFTKALTPWWLLTVFWWGSHLCYGQAPIDSILVTTIQQSEDLPMDSAIQLLQQVRAFPQFDDADCKNRADFFFAIGTNYYLMDNEAAALPYWRDTALVLYESCLGPTSYLAAKARFNTGFALKYLQRYTEALAFLKQGTAIFEAIPDLPPDDLAYRYLETGKLHEQLEDYNQALIYLRQAQRQYQKAAVENDEVADLYNYLGVCYHQLGQLATAISYLNQAKSLFQTIGDTDALRLVDQNLARVYLEQEDYQQARTCIDRAIAANTQQGNAGELGKNLHVLGILQKRQEQYDQALLTFQQAIEASERAHGSRFHSEVAAGYENAADVYILQENVDEGIAYYQQAMQSLVASFSSTSIYANPSLQQQAIKNKGYLQRVLDLKGQALLKRYDQSGNDQDIEGALDCYRAVDTLSNLLRRQLSTGSSRYRLQQYLVPIYERAITVAITRYEATQNPAYLEEAYAFAAKNKALLLLDGLQDEQAQLTANIPDAFLEQENQLKLQLNNLEQAIFALDVLEDTEKAEPLKADWFATRRQYEQLIDEMEQTYPAYYAMKYAFRTPLPTADLQALLPRQTLLIEYFVGERNIFAFTISQGGTTYYQWSKPAAFEQTCRAFRQSTQATMTDWESTYLQTGYQLYSWLLQPILEGTDDDVSINRLFIIPDGELLQIAFDALLYEPTTTWEGKDNPYLLRRYATTQAYSNRLLFDGQAGARTKGYAGEYLGFGIEYDDYTLDELEKLAGTPDSLIQKRAAGKLPYSDDEVLEIADILNGTAIVNRAATKQQFFAQAKDFRMLHMAMHGVLDEANPLQSGLIFSRTDDSTSFILRAGEIYQLQLAADMAVLSACNTGYGRLEKGEGVRSLARAFAYAGCPSLVASLWEAPDNASKQILVEFYRFLQEGHPKDVALQKAKLAYMEASPQAYSSPGYWGHLTVIGDAEPVFQRTNKRWIWLLLLIPILGGIARLVRRKRQSIA